ncbi:hypothetical protein F2Q69_00036761 [Brassica cretica]|uniref:Uncharacterized protein n=1 Tax=Brassica cretica TaxID=69181 RepID=A0A8S9SJW1_BRACR|nr:hypothetical protein F2Q69_00036761 [Brassica cretica]
MKLSRNGGISTSVSDLQIRWLGVLLRVGEEFSGVGGFVFSGRVGETFLPSPVLLVMCPGFYEITWIMFSTQLRNSSNKNQIKWSSDERVMQFTKPVVFSSREFGPAYQLGFGDSPETSSLLCWVLCSSYCCCVVHVQLPFSELRRAVYDLFLVSSDGCSNLSLSVFAAFGVRFASREAAFLNLLWVMGETIRRESLMFGYVIPAPVLNLLVHNGGLIHSLIVGLEEQHQNVALTAPDFCYGVLEAQFPTTGGGWRIEFLRLRFAKLSGDGINHLEQR